jgi:hypothetical protein
VAVELYLISKNTFTHTTQTNPLRQWGSHTHIITRSSQGWLKYQPTHSVSYDFEQMLKHGRAGVPMEVMGLMLGEFVDEYTVQVIDVFAMPQSGTTVTVESVDHVFQTKMVEMLKQTGR